MSAGKYNFYIEQGSTFITDIQYTDNSGNPIDLSGYHGKMQIRSAITSNTAYLTLSSSLAPDGTGLHFSGSGDILPPASGTIGIVIGPYSSSMLNWTGDAVYDLEIYTGTGDTLYVERLLEGKVRLSKEVTR